MFRLALSILLVVAFSCASAASVMHGLSHGSEHVGHHAEMAAGDAFADAGEALADCCDTTGGVWSASCLGDLVTTAEITPIAPAATLTRSAAHADAGSSGLTPAVPTGPPKV